ncbi:MAG: sensor histidine kinase [Eubacteriales bacterium]
MESKKKTVKSPVRHPHGYSVRVKIFSGFLIFVVVTLLILLLFQVVLLPYLYGNIKIRQVKEGSRRIVEAANTDAFFTVGKEVAEEYQFEIVLISADAASRLKLSNTGYPECVLYDLPYSDCQQILNLTKETGGEGLFSVRQTESRLVSDQNLTVQEGEEVYAIENYGGFLGTDGGNVIYTTVFTTNSGEYLLAVNAYLTPIGATAQTLSVILLAVAILMTLLALILASYISGRVAGPIVRIHEKVGTFTEGRYEPCFDENSGYKEANELSATLNQAAIELSKVENLRRELIANVSHDLRTPLTLIEGYSEMMRDIPGEATPENLNVIINEVDRLNSLVSDLLETSRIQSGNVKLHPEPFCLTDELSKLLETYTALTKRDGYQIKVVADRKVNVNADRSLIVRAIMNLVNNAMTYTGPDRSVVIRQLLRDDFVRIEVSDSGEGIAPEQLDRIWDRYYKVDAEHKRAAKGTGLGLSIVKSIVTMHGGNYGVRSRVGQGSTFWIEIPRMT